MSSNDIGGLSLRQFIQRQLVVLFRTRDVFRSRHRGSGSSREVATEKIHQVKVSEKNEERSPLFRHQQPVGPVERRGHGNGRLEAHDPCTGSPRLGRRVGRLHPALPSLPRTEVEDKTHPNQDPSQIVRSGDRGCSDGYDHAEQYPDKVPPPRASADIYGSGIEGSYRRASRPSQVYERDHGRQDDCMGCCEEGSSQDHQRQNTGRGPTSGSDPDWSFRDLCSKAIQSRPNPLLQVPALRPHFEDVPSKPLHLRHLQWQTQDLSLRGEAGKRSSASEMQQLQRETCHCIESVPGQTSKGTSDADCLSSKAEEEHQCHPASCTTICAISRRLPIRSARHAEEDEDINNTNYPEHDATQYQGCYRRGLTSARCHPKEPPVKVIAPKPVESMKSPETALTPESSESTIAAHQKIMDMLITQLQQVQPLLAIKTPETRELVSMMMEAIHQLIGKIRASL